MGGLLRRRAAVAAGEAMQRCKTSAISRGEGPEINLRLRHYCDVIEDTRVMLSKPELTPTKI
jgi:hypothetical protein